MIRELDALLVDWGAWVRRLEAGSLGFPSRTAESRCGEGRSPNRPSTLVPIVRVPERLCGLDRAIRDMPRGLRMAVELRYLSDLSREDQESLWVVKTLRSTRSLYERLDQAHYWLAGRLSHNPTEKHQ